MSSCIICRFINWLAHRICPDIVWNREMSREIDRLKFENEQLREHLAETVLDV